MKAAFLVAWSASLFLAGVQASTLTDRHNEAPKNKHGDPAYPRSSLSNGLALTVSPCFPEDDGYFGSTMGIPVMLQYGFEMEYSEGAQIEQALETIREQIVSTVVSNAFPEVCGSRRRQLQTSTLLRPTGFHFNSDLMDDMFLECSPSLSMNNICSVYQSTVSIYGVNVNENVVNDVVGSIEAAMRESLGSVTPFGIFRLRVLGDQNAPEVNESPSDKSSMGIAGPIVAALLALMVVLFGGIFVMLIYLRRDMQYRQEMAGIKAPEIYLQDGKGGETTNLMEFFKLNGGTCSDTESVLTASVRSYESEVLSMSHRMEGGQGSVFEGLTDVGSDLGRPY